jgi:hypothetical protein
MTTTLKQTIQIQLHADHRCQYFKNMILLMYIMKIANYVQISLQLVTEKKEK